MSPARNLSIAGFSDETGQTIQKDLRPLATSACSASRRTDP